MNYVHAKKKAENVLAEFRAACPKEAKLVYSRYEGAFSLTSFMADVIMGKRTRLQIGLELFFRMTDTGYEIYQERTTSTHKTLWEGDGKGGDDEAV